jgi:hypothetical protein
MAFRILGEAKDAAKAPAANLSRIERAWDYVWDYPALR